jgi:structure-specific recognition protein 1
LFVQNEGRVDVSGGVLTWTSNSGDQRSSVPLEKITAAQWLDMGRACQLWLKTSNADGSDAGYTLRLDNFKPGDFDRLSPLLATPSLTLKRVAPSASGRNWGTLRVAGKDLEFLDIEKGAIIAPLPLSAVSHAAVIKGRGDEKGEVEIQFFDADNVDKEDEVLIEMKVYVPAGHKLLGEAATKAAEDLRGSAKKGDDEDGDDGEVDSAVVLHKAITERAGIAGVTGEAVAGKIAGYTCHTCAHSIHTHSLCAEVGEDAGQFLVPRGRYAIEMYPTFVRLVGTTYEFKVRPPYYIIV